MCSCAEPHQTNYARLFDSWHDFQTVCDEFPESLHFCHLCSSLFGLQPVPEADKLTPQKVQKFFLQIAETMEILHENKIAHRDLKPENIMVDSQQIKIIDFGFSVCAKESPTVKLLSGSTMYVSPEMVDLIHETQQGRWEKHSGYNVFFADVWSCGVILFEMAYGRVPYDDDNDQATCLCKIEDGELNYPQDCKTSPFYGLLEGMLHIKGQGKEDKRLYEWKDIIQRI